MLGTYRLSIDVRVVRTTQLPLSVFQAHGSVAVKVLLWVQPCHSLWPTVVSRVLHVTSGQTLTPHPPEHSPLVTTAEVQAGGRPVILGFPVPLGDGRHLFVISGH